MIDPDDRLLNTRELAALELLEEQMDEILDSTKIHISTLKPSEWYEQNMIMPRGSAFPGPFSFNLTPYWREPLDCAAKDHPAKEISIMKGAQLGGTAAVLNPVVGYTIAQNPGNIMFLTGHSDLSKAAVLKIDQMIDNCGLRALIRPNVLRAKNMRTGDTDKSKEFAGGDFKSGSVTNHNLLRQHDVMIMIVDDYDAAPGQSKEAGSTRELVQKRTSAFAHKKKIFWVSSPQLKGTSNIEAVFMRGDQRYYNVPCPCCGSQIVLKWSVAVNDKETAGIFWKLDQHGNLDRKSVGYVCQSCAGFFDDSHKYEMNMAGCWVPTAIPKEEDHYSYQISSLYAPPGMDNWAFYVQQFLEANPPGSKRLERKVQTFLNVVMGETYEQEGEAPKANELQKNIRPYDVGIIPEKLSIRDGNGKIVLLTCASDLNGVVDDARLDFEVLAWSESGACYSVLHGSIGTFVPREGEKKFKEDRERWTYEHHQARSVWPELEKRIGQAWPTDTGRRMKIFITGVDTGHYTNYAYAYIDSSAFHVVGLKGKDVDKYVRFGADLSSFKIAKERPNLYLVEVNQLKDDLADFIKLKFDPGNDEKQPANFMNFPTPALGLYLFNNYFSHFEAEHKVTESKEGEAIAARWVKKTSVSQNHFWDVRVYNMVLRDIMVYMMGKEFDVKNPTWQDYVELLMKQIGSNK
jgi:phage terminase large subunit GpA-like protein